MKTIRQIAEEIGVTKQAIFYKIKKPPLVDDLKYLVSKENGILTVSLDGEKLIKQAFGVDVGIKEPSKENSSFDGRLIELLCDTVDVLKTQLKTKDKQIEELNATIKVQAESARHKPQKEKAYSRKKLSTPKGKSAPIERLIKGAR